MVIAGGFVIPVALSQKGKLVPGVVLSLPKL